MAKQQPILVTAHEFRGGTANDPVVIPAGTVVDGDVIKKLGLSDRDVERHVFSGALLEQNAYEAPSTLPPGQTAPGTTGTEFEGLSIDQMHKFLDDHGVDYPEDASAPDLMKIALEHTHPRQGEGNLATEEADAAYIERTMKVDAIRADLDKLEVPYETDANKPALAAALARARASRA